jgi:hypothetical protein
LKRAAGSGTATPEEPASSICIDHCTMFSAPPRPAQKSTAKAGDAAAIKSPSFPMSALRRTNRADAEAHRTLAHIDSHAMYGEG